MDVKVRIRDGCRGGQEQFRWNQVTSQDFKDREQYLGQSTKVGTMGKFGRYYLHDWYSKKRDTPDLLEAEQASVRAYEEELMQEALGLKPKKLLLQKQQLTEEELRVHLAREGCKPEGKQGRTPMGPQKKIVVNEFGEQVSEEDFVGKAYLETTIKGLGFASHRTAKLEEYKANALGTTAKLEGCIKVQDDDDDVIRFGFDGHAKSESSTKREPGVKMEEEAEHKVKRDAALKDEFDAKSELGDTKAELEDSKDSMLRGSKRFHPEGAEGALDKKARKAEKKEAKRLKKLKKKEKKLERRLKKATKKADRKANRSKRRSSSDSSSSSS